MKIRMEAEQCYRLGCTLPCCWRVRIACPPPMVLYTHDCYTTFHFYKVSSQNPEQSTVLNRHTSQTSKNKTIFRIQHKFRCAFPSGNNLNVVPGNLTSRKQHILLSIHFTNVSHGCFKSFLLLHGYAVTTDNASPTLYCIMMPREPIQ